MAKLEAEFERRTLLDSYTSERLCSEWFDPPSRPEWCAELDLSVIEVLSR
ncbi:hypothetical protein ACGF0D_35965 [Kitasatospora sp. NPDC048298]